MSGELKNSEAADLSMEKRVGWSQIVEDQDYSEKF